MDEEKILYSEGITIEDTHYEIIPPKSTSETRGGFVAEEKTDDDSLQVSIDSETGKAYAYKPKSDKSLSVDGGYADAKVTGDKFSELEETKADKSMIGNPITALSSDDFKNTRYIYVYLGNEEGYVNGDWYYYNGQMWVDGGKYGVLNISRSVPTPSTGNGVSEVAQKLLANILNRSAYVLPQKLNIEGLIEELASTDTDEKWAVVYDLENVTSGSEVHSVLRGDSYNSTLTYDADTTDVTVFMGDLDVTEDVLKDKVINIKNVTDHVKITDQIKYVKLNTNLTGATISTSLTKVVKDSSFEFTYSIQDGYELESITIMVGEDNVTEDSVYPESHKVIIDKCYDDVTITVNCIQKEE